MNSVTIIAGAGGLIYGCLLFVGSLFLAFGGHGSYIPLRVFSAPCGEFGVEAAFVSLPVMWIVMAMLSMASSARARTMFRFLLIVHYVGIIAALVQYLPREIDEYLEFPKWHVVFRLCMMFSVGVYVAGQAFLIYRMSCGFRRLPKNSQDG
ncbi:MAG: hypothetical protein WA117_08345 [Verrucomicrobiia bacterium]